MNNALNTVLRFLGTAEVAELLLKNGAIVDFKEEKGNSPLNIAAYWGE